MTSVVQGAVEALYAAFEQYQMNDPFEYCDHCISAQDVAHLRSTPLRALHHDDLWMVAMNIMLTIGDDRDFRYFLPRLIEGLVENALYDAEIVFARCGDAGYGNWPLAEREAVEHFLKMQLETILSNEPVISGIGDFQTFINCIGMLPIPVAPFLESWPNRNGEWACRILLNYLHYEVSADGNDFANAFWCMEGHWQVLDWLHRPKVVAYAKAAYEQFPFDDPELDRNMRRKIQALEHSGA